MPLDYATEFSVDYYDDFALITIGGTDRYLLIPENAKAPADLDTDIIPIQKPDTIYLAASAGMDYFRVLKALDTVRMTSTQAVNWSLPEVVQALDSEKMLYAGKYSAPDYELLLREGIDLAIESTMIYHTPDTKEKIEKLGVPVLVDKSSYEPHPLGRMEWIRLYGLLLGKTDEADAFYNDQLASLTAVPELSKMLSSTGSAQNPVASQDSPTVAYFYITSSGYANVRSPGDYISKMIEMAGGSYAFADVSVSEDSAKATMNMQMEAFLDRALVSDILIYSTSIDGEMHSAEELFKKAPMLKQSKAASDGNIWGTGKNMYQQSTAVAEMMLELHAVVTGHADEDELIFLHKLK
ncbi:MAG: ABC transporter substrate-binding protein [Lachnospiraceae bacterium]|nr:ABC transporter substrate-binding protein [Lachnospiraceae bacterium]